MDFPLTTTDCKVPIENAKTLADIKICHDDTAFWCNSYCCGSCFESEEQALKILGDLESIRSNVLRASVMSAQEELIKKQNQEIQDLQEQHLIQLMHLNGQLIGWTDRLDPDHIYLTYEERQELGL